MNLKHPRNGRLSIWLLLCLLIHLSPAALAGNAAPTIPDGSVISGRVVAISDGDTLKVLTSKKVLLRVRLAQIDAPESHQAFGSSSKASLSELVFNKSVWVRVQDTDRYGRLVATLVADGININEAQVHRGMAWVYRQYVKDKGLLEIERVAREARVGLWRDPSPTPPVGVSTREASKKPVTKKNFRSTANRAEVLEQAGSTSSRRRLSPSQAVDVPSFFTLHTRNRAHSDGGFPVRGVLLPAIAPTRATA